MASIKIPDFECDVDVDEIIDEMIQSDEFQSAVKEVFDEEVDYKALAEEVEGYLDMVTDHTFNDHCYETKEKIDSHAEMIHLLQEEVTYLRKTVDMLEKRSLRNLTNKVAQNIRKFFHST